MMMRRGILAGLLFGVWGCTSTTTTSPDVSFRMHTINANSAYEAVSVFDVDRDGTLDVFSGPYWYEGPDFSVGHFTREVKTQGGYHMGFCDLPMDIDGDGHTDTVTAAWHNRRISWIRNPGRAGLPWREIVVDEPGNIETAILADINGDGQQDVLPNIFNGEPGWYEFRSDPGLPSGAQWRQRVLPTELAGAGVGAGDIDGDGRCDVVGCKGWARQSAEPDGKWSWHGEFDLKDPSIPILVHDLDADGDADLIYGIGHNYGVYWLEQERNAIGQRVWTQHEIDRSFSQAHVVMLGDLDGDGQAELITGKRYYAHNGKDPGGKEPKCLYWYDFDRDTHHWTRHVIQEGGPAGVGTSADVVDLDADGDLDLVCPGKSGLYWFENLRLQ